MRERARAVNVRQLSRRMGLVEGTAGAFGSCVLDMRRVIRLLLSFMLLAFALWCVLKLRADLASASLAPAWHSWDLVCAALLLSVLNYLLRALRWRWYLARLGHALPFGFCCLTYSAGFAFTLSPGKLGEVARARYYTGLGVPLREITAAFCVERMLDLVAVLALATGLVALLPHYFTVIWMSAAALAAGLLLAVTLARVARWDGASRWLTTAGRVVQAARPLLTARALAIGGGLGLGAWSLEALGFYILAFMFPGAHLTFQVAVGIYAIAILAGAVALLPGGLGGTEAVMTTLLVSQGFTLTAALLLTLVCRLVTLWFAVALGLLAVLVLRLRRQAAGVLL